MREREMAGAGMGYPDGLPPGISKWLEGWPDVPRPVSSRVLPMATEQPNVREGFTELNDVITKPKEQQQG